jgi:DNA-binding transcriptional LysR family regulator
MQLKNIEIFCDVVAVKSFSKGGSNNRISQSAASQAVHQLEKHLGTKLIDRNKRPIELTPAGEVYYGRCRLILSQLRNLEDEVQKLGNKRVSGRLRLGAIYSVGLLQMNQFVRKYQIAFPDVEIDLVYLHPEEVYEHIANEQCDMGIVSFPKGASEFEIIPWQDQRMVLATARDHTLSDRKQIDLQELEGEKLISFTSNLVIRKKLDSWLKREGMVLETVYEFDNVEYVKRAVEINNGVAILPLPTMSREVETGTLCAIELNGCDWVRPMGIIHKRGRILTSPAKLFLKLLTEESLVEV